MRARRVCARRPLAARAARHHAAGVPIAGGLLLFAIAFEMVYGRRSDRQSRTSEQAAHEDALARLRKTLELDPNYWAARQFVVSAYVEKGMFAEAVAEARKAK